MAFKFVTVLALLAAASAVPVEYQGYYGQQALVKSYAPQIVKTIAAPVYKQVQYEHEAPAEYEFEYGVHDAHTGDIKSQKEVRKGDSVHGYYELVEPDGHKRTVEYTADDHHGFNAIVHREETNIKVPVPVQQVHKVAYAPVTKLAYSAPVTKVAYSAPVTKLAYSAPVANLGYASYASPVVSKLAYSAPVANLGYGSYASPVVSKLAYSAPVAKVAYASPVSYAAPVTKLAYAATPVSYATPIAKVAYAAPSVQYSSGLDNHNYHY